MTPRQQSILVGAIVTGVLSTSYLSFINTLCCLGVILGGAVTVQQFTSRTGSSIEAGEGAILGALAGMGGAVLGSVIDRALRPFELDSQTISQGVMEDMMQGMQGMEGQQEMMQQFQGEVGMTMFIMGLLFSVVLYAVFGAIGGALGSAFFGTDARPETGQIGETEPNV